MKTDVSEITNFPQFVLYPNPSTGSITLQSSNFIPGQLNVELLNLTGIIIKSLYNGQYDYEELKFDVSFLNKGIYIIRTVQNSVIKTFKLIMV